MKRNILVVFRPADPADYSVLYDLLATILRMPNDSSCLQLSGDP